MKFSARNGARFVVIYTIVLKILYQKGRWKNAYVLLDFGCKLTDQKGTFISELTIFLAVILVLNISLGANCFVLYGQVLDSLAFNDSIRFRFKE